MADPKVTYRFTAKDQTKGARESVKRGLDSMRIAAVAFGAAVAASIVAAGRELLLFGDRLRELDRQIKQARGFGLENRQEFLRLEETFQFAGLREGDAQQALTKLREQLSRAISGDLESERKLDALKLLGIDEDNVKDAVDNIDATLLAFLARFRGTAGEVAAFSEIFGGRLGGRLATGAPNIVEGLARAENARRIRGETPDLDAAVERISDNSTEISNNTKAIFDRFAASEVREDVQDFTLRAQRNILGLQSDGSTGIVNALEQTAQVYINVGREIVDVFRGGSKF